MVTENGHGCTLTYLAPGMPEKNYRTHAEDLRPLYEKTLEPDQIRMLHHLRVAVGNVFPHFSFIETQSITGEKSVLIRLWQPLGGAEMEIMSWVLAEKEASDGYKSRALNAGIHNFGAAGVFEQDDLEVWASATDAGDNTIALRYPYGFQTALKYLDAPTTDHPWPGRAFRPANTEVAQFHFMCRWDEVMRSNA